jgi:hypothetical protein
VWIDGELRHIETADSFLVCEQHLV